MEQVVENSDLVVMESPIVCDKQSDIENFTKTPVPLSKSPATSPSIRSMTQTVIVSLKETVTHDITYGKLLLHWLTFYLSHCASDVDFRNLFIFLELYKTFTLTADYSVYFQIFTWKRSKYWIFLTRHCESLKLRGNGVRKGPLTFYVCNYGYVEVRIKTSVEFLIINRFRWSRFSRIIKAN